MTQFMAMRGFALARASRATKVLITAFELTVALAIAVGIVNYRLRTGLSPSGAISWYRGTPGGGGPLFEKSPLELLDATHPHLFGQAFLFFVLCHIFALTSAREGVKIFVYLAAFGSVLVDAASPWLIRYVSPEFGWLQVAGTAVMTVVFLLLVVAPLREMWCAPPRDAQARDLAA